jgi:predicted ATP-grasp superfamily ATP-dependent carboligase
MIPKILILGGSRDQYATLITVKNLNFISIVVDHNKDCYCKTDCDIFLNISTRDPENIIKALEIENLKPDSIIVQGTDIPHIASIIAKYFSIPYITESSALLSIDKFLLKSFLNLNDILVPKCIKIYNIEEAIDFSDLHGFPVVLKPNFKSGSLGVFYIENIKTLINCFNLTFKTTELEYILIEKYIPGIQISSESIINNYNAYTYGIAERNYDLLDITKPNIIENGGIQPFAESKLYYNKINNLIQKVAHLLGIKDGFLKGDLIISDNGDVYILEVATRLSGGDFCETLIPISLDFDYMKLCVLSSLNKINKFPPPDFKKFVSNKYFFPEKEGLIEDIIIDDKILNEEWLHKIEFYFKKGDIYNKPISHGTRFGVFVVFADTLNELNNKIRLVYNSVKIIIK